MKYVSPLLGIVCATFFCLVLAVTSSLAQEAEYRDLDPGSFMRKWLVLGPLSAEDSKDSRIEDTAKSELFEADLLESSGGESESAPKDGDTIEFGGAESKWRYVRSSDEMIHLDKVVGQHDWSVAYASAEIYTDEPGKALFGIGSDDAVRIWLNGELVHDQWIGRAADFDQDLVAFTLKKGKNRLLVKVLNQRGDWSFACRPLGEEQLVNKLAVACRLGDKEQAELLLDAGAEIDALSDVGLSALQVAQMLGDQEIAEFLISKGASDDREFPPAKSLVNALVSERVKRKGPAVSVLVAIDGKAVYSASFGSANIEHQIPATTQTKFRIGSVSKQFTAASILKLQEEGKLSVDDRLDKYFPDFPRGDEVTLHHLLTHTSGIKSYTSKPDFLQQATSKIAPEDLIESFKNDPYDFSPGEKWAYNNSGYFLLGEIVAKVSGMSYGEYLRETFFDPLGMKNSGIHTSTAILPDEAAGYAYVDGEVQKALNWDMSRAGGAGAIYSTVEDLQLWNEALFNGKVLSEASLKAAFTPVKIKEGEPQMPYGYGWIIGKLRGVKKISHSGGLHGFLSFLARYPEQNMTIAALHNASPPLPGVTPPQLADQIAELYLWREMKPRSPNKIAEVDVESFDDFVGTYDYTGAIMTVSRTGDRLFAQLTGQPKLEIFPSGDAKFFWKAVDAQVEFLRDKQGKVIAAEHTQGGITFKAPRIVVAEAVEVKQEILDKYIGKYRYAGIGVLTVRRDGNQLYAQMTGQPELPIFARSDTQFFWKAINAQVEFVTGEEGQVEKVIHQQGGGEIEAPKIE